MLRGSFKTLLHLGGLVLQHDTAADGGAAVDTKPKRDRHRKPKGTEGGVAAPEETWEEGLRYQSCCCGMLDVPSHTLSCRSLKKPSDVAGVLVAQMWRFTEGDVTRLGSGYTGPVGAVMAAATHLRHTILKALATNVYSKIHPGRPAIGGRGAGHRPLQANEELELAIWVARKKRTR